MRRYSPQQYSPPRRGYGGRPRSPPRSPPRRGYGGGGGGGGGGGYGRRRDQNQGSLLVRNIPLDCRQEELRTLFQRFGALRDVYMPKDYHTGEPRGFAFVQFVEPYDSIEAQRRVNGQIFAGREISVVVAAESRKRPEDMRHRTRSRGGGRGERSSYYGRSRSRSLSRSRSPRYPESRSRYRSRSYSPAPRQRDYSASPPERRHADPAGPVRSPRGRPQERDGNIGRRSYSPAGGYHTPEELEKGNGFSEKHGLEEEGDRRRPSSPGKRVLSRSLSGSRSRSPNLSPAAGRRR
ncbi:Serine/arginine-rich SC35-like splicing factor SCL30 [Linum grandiflorum]